jgi:hypothetical protein
MINRKSWSVVILLLGVSCVGAGAPPRARAASGEVRTDAAPPVPYNLARSTPTIESAMMPGDRIDKPMLLDDQLEALRAALPNFNSVIVRDPGVAADYPMLPAMTLKNVTVGQFLQFVAASFPGVQFRQIDGPAGSLYAFRIRLEDEAIRRAQLEQEKKRVRLFRLNEYITSLADASPDKEKPREQRIKEATSQVLSLLQAALEQTEGEGPTVVQIHEPTLTLLFKGSSAKQLVLEEALSTLQPQASRSYRVSSARPGSGDQRIVYDDFGRELTFRTAPQVPDFGRWYIDGRSSTTYSDYNALKQQEDAVAQLKDYQAQIADLKMKLDALRAQEKQNAATQPLKD